MIRCRQEVDLARLMAVRTLGLGVAGLIRFAGCLNLLVRLVLLVELANTIDEHFDDWFVSSLS